MPRIAAADWVFAALLAAAAALTFSFTAQDTLATFGDDSASYLTLAHWLAGSSGDKLVSEWAGYQSHFPPLWPLVLAATGGFHDYRIAYAAVASCAVAALPLIYAYTARDVGRSGALAIVVLFLMSATAWTSIKGILSEPLFLLVTMAALLHFEIRLAHGRGGLFDHVLFGTLLGCAMLARATGVALLLAYCAQAILMPLVLKRGPFRRVRLVPLVPCIALVALWYAVRPSSDWDVYGRTATGMAASWMEHPGAMLSAAVKTFASGWVSGFALDSTAPAPLQWAIGVLGLVGIAGVALRLAGNRLDAWYAAITLAIVFGWIFSAENTRRLMYPLVPLLLLSAGDLLRRAVARAALAGRVRLMAFGAVAAAQALVSLPALAVIAARAADHEPVIQGYRYTYRDVTDYYTTIDGDEARKRALVVVATLAGLESIAGATPPQATVMWIRPEYVALLGRRRAVPLYYHWDARELAAEIARTGADHVVVSFLMKTDLGGQRGNSRVDTRAYARPVLVLLDGVYTLVRVDRGALERYLSAAPAASR